MTVNMVHCPRCGQVHEAEVVDGLVDIKLMKCPFQPRGTATMVGYVTSPRGVVTIELGEEIGERCESH